METPQLRTPSPWMDGDDGWSAVSQPLSRELSLGLRTPSDQGLSEHDLGHEFGGDVSSSPLRPLSISSPARLADCSSPVRGWPEVFTSPPRGLGNFARDSPVRSDISSGSALATRRLQKDNVTCLVIQRVGTLSVSDFLEIVREGLGERDFAYIKNTKLIHQPNGDKRIDIWVENEACRHTLTRLRGLGKKNKWRVEFWRSWKERVGTNANPKAATRPQDHTLPRRLVIATYNINGLVGKAEALLHFLEQEKVSIALVQETLVEKNMHRISIPGFQVFQKAAVKGGPGFRGQALILRLGLTGFELDLDPNLLAVKVAGIPGDKDWLFCSVYLPSGGNHRGSRGMIMRRIRRQLRKWSRANPSLRVVLGGDWNIVRERTENLLPKWNVPYGILPTRGSDKTHVSRLGRATWTSLDYFVVNTNAASELTSSVVHRGWDLSDHFPVLTQLKAAELLSEKSKEEWTKVRTRIARTGFEDRTEAFVTHNRWQVLADMPIESSEDLDKFTAEFEATVKEVAKDVNIAISETAADKAGHVHKLPEQVKRAINKRRLLRRKWLISEGDAADIVEPRYQAQKALVKRLLQRDREHRMRLFLSYGCQLLCQNISAAYWRWLEQLTFYKGRAGQVIRPVRNNQGVLQVDPQSIAQAQADHYEALGKDTTGRSGDWGYWTKRFVPEGKRASVEADQLFEATVTWQELQARLKELSNGKATGVDEIHNEILKTARYGAEEDDHSPPNQFATVLLKYVNHVYCTGLVPASDRVGLVVSLFKEGDTADMSNYRGLTLINHKQKLVNAVLTSRISSYLENESLFVKEQAGFRAKEEAIGQVCALYEAVRRRSNAGLGPTFVFFGDFKKAFDMVPHGLLVAKLQALGISECIIRALKNTYSLCSAKVRVGEHLSDEYRIEKGVRQGDIPSPVLFLVVINDLSKQLARQDTGASIPGMLYKLSSLLFADDSLGLTDSVGKIQPMLDIFKEWADDNDMQFGIKKCGLMALNATHDQEAAFRESDFFLGEEVVPHVDVYKYLGILLNHDFGRKGSSFDDHTFFARTRAAVVAKKLAKLRVFFRNKSIPLMMRITCFRTQILPVATYGGEWAGMKSEVSRIIQAEVNRGLKWLLGAKSKNTMCNPAVFLLELGLKPVSVSMAELRARAYLKYPSETSTVIHDLCNNVPTNRSKTWYTYTEWYARVHLDTPLSRLPEGASDNETDTDSCLESVSKGAHNLFLKSVESSVAMRHYSRYGFEKTRDFVKHAAWVPQLSVGVVWLCRMRTHAVWTARTRASALGDEAPARLLGGKCPRCGVVLAAGTDESFHVLVACRGYKKERREYLAEYLPGIRAEASRLHNEGLFINTTLDNLVGALLTGGLLESSQCLFTQAFGHDSKVVLDFGDYTYGYLPVAKFLAKVMPSHMGVLFGDDLVDREAGYISVSQSDF